MHLSVGLQKHRSSRIMSLTFVFRRDRLRGGFKSWGEWCILVQNFISIAYLPQRFAERGVLGNI